MPGKKWTEQEEQILRKMFPHYKTQTVADILGRSYRSISLHALFLGLKKSDEYIKEFKEFSSKNINRVGIAHRFKKGLIPHNKGKVQQDWIGEEGLKNVKRTQFKKGQRPATAPPAGTVTIQDHKGRKFKVVGSKFVHVIEWEKVYGKIPKGYFIRCLSDDTLNTDPSNWELVNRSENMNKNSAQRFPEPIRKTIQLRGALNRQINKHIRKLNNEK